MTLTAKQVREQLGYTRGKLEKLAELKVLVPINTRDKGAKKFYPLYDSKDVNAHKTARKAEAVVQVKATPKFLEPVGIAARLASIEQKLDNLIKIWS